jgi:hypothetical protein
MSKSYAGFTSESGMFETCRAGLTNVRSSG